MPKHLQGDDAKANVASQKALMPAETGDTTVDNVHKQQGCTEAVAILTNQQNLGLKSSSQDALDDTKSEAGGKSEDLSQVEIKALDNAQEFPPIIAVSSIVKLALFFITMFLAYIGLYGYVL